MRAAYTTALQQVGLFGGLDKRRFSRKDQGNAYTTAARCRIGMECVISRFCYCRLGCDYGLWQEAERMVNR